VGAATASDTSMTAKQWRKCLRQVRTSVERLNIVDSNTAWSGYYDDDFAPLSSPEQWDVKQRQVADILARLKPETVHDVAGNRGWYAQLAEQMGSRVVCSDVDETCLNRAYRDARDENRNVTVVYQDLRNPGPAMGWGSQEFSAANDRLRCDCVLALAVMHHMVFRAMADFETVLDSLAQMTSRDLVLEFVPKDDQYVKQWWSPKYDWYEQQTLLRAAERRFREISVLPSEPPGRLLLVCRGVRAAMDGGRVVENVSRSG
jgi:hypothetical protein